MFYPSTWAVIQSVSTPALTGFFRLIEYDPSEMVDTSITKHGNKRWREEEKNRQQISYDHPSQPLIGHTFNYVIKIQRHSSVHGPCAPYAHMHICTNFHSHDSAPSYWNEFPLCNACKDGMLKLMDNKLLADRRLVWSVYFGHTLTRMTGDSSRFIIAAYAWNLFSVLFPPPLIYESFR